MYEAYRCVCILKLLDERVDACLCRLDEAVARTRLNELIEACRHVADAFGDIRVCRSLLVERQMKILQTNIIIY